MTDRGMNGPDDDGDMLRLDRQVCFPIYAASNMLNRLYRPVLAKLELTYPQYLVMLVLWQDNPQSVGSLGNALYLDSGTLTPLLKRMEQAGLITRTRDTMDERRVAIGLTRKGHDLRARALDVPATLAEGLHLSLEDAHILRERVSALIAALNGKAALPRSRAPSQAKREK
ncbi:MULTISPECIES: MarR family winged helix-turn-helix transcriptional regulator [Sphingobium]|uniref:MarR family winged helix-turn-helix transcriptional regulator n=1 Tax=Sphingobium TaxID=165695 RepID=UPI001C3F64DD|nr:MarR family transcriptional regulator [Sphingobium sp. 15-1]